MARQRLRDLGLHVGDLQTGPMNAITDVGGVLVGQVTLVEDSPYCVRSGVTVIEPAAGESWIRHLFAGAHVLNGNGELTGLAWVNEFGLLCGPIALTGTYSVGAVYEGLSKAETHAGTTANLYLPMVGETDDSWLSDRAAFAVRPDHAELALSRASGGPVAEGCVGSGTGMITHEFKAGIGTASRTVELSDRNFTVGVLVQTNYGRRARLSLNGRPVGEQIGTDAVASPWPTPRDNGSIIVIVATDTPLLPHQCTRLAQRAGLGVGRVGGTGAPGSGDIFLCFSTANSHDATETARIHSVEFVSDMALGPLFAAVIEATEESIWNALCGAETMTGQHGRTAHAIPYDLLTRAIAT